MNITTKAPIAPKKYDARGYNMLTLVRTNRDVQAEMKNLDWLYNKPFDILTFLK